MGQGILFDKVIALKQTGGDPSGWHLPEWSLRQSEALMDSSSTKTTIFSLTAPEVPILRGTAATQLARHVSEYGANLRESNPSRFGFFAALPCLCDSIEAALEEIRYSLDHLKAAGITLYTRYGPGNHYQGHADFLPI